MFFPFLQNREPVRNRYDNLHQRAPLYGLPSLLRNHVEMNYFQPQHRLKSQL